MDKYNAILNKLQHTAPIVTDPEGLTQRIMKEIEQPVIRRRSKIRIIMTGIAASALSGGRFISSVFVVGETTGR